MCFAALGMQGLSPATGEEGEYSEQRTAEPVSAAQFTNQLMDVIKEDAFFSSNFEV